VAHRNTSLLLTDPVFTPARMADGIFVERVPGYPAGVSLRIEDTITKSS